jgi:predicted AlkP superfamily phosphohydrolase/phosphomutase
MFTDWAAKTASKMTVANTPGQRTMTVAHALVARVRAFVTARWRVERTYLSLQSSSRVDAPFTDRTVTSERSVGEDGKYRSNGEIVKKAKLVGAPA